MWPCWHNVRKVNEQWWFHQRLKYPDQHRWKQHDFKWIVKGKHQSDTLNCSHVAVLYIFSTSVWISCRPVHWFGSFNEANLHFSCFQQLLCSKLQVRTSVLWEVYWMNVERRPVWWGAHQMILSPLSWGDMIGVDRPMKRQWAVNELAFSSWQEMRTLYGASPKQCEQ